MIIDQLLAVQTVVSRQRALAENQTGGTGSPLKEKRWQLVEYLVRS